MKFGPGEKCQHYSKGGKYVKENRPLVEKNKLVAT